ncbi:hypothetical protein HYH02_008774 [Chlamydomonas schloesseri]|uniref:Phospholipid/glycerol acyltransferase domain-containing protein n=1 Tax=Chlamydomonas schloesseri TaxID=2026947 RepID=A0A835WDC4_9CHLO|nr:hypothetical protein HYH02_008774 [Chlamydomonas schloesseri]|eukprot:KAG2445308.1 hypothetical protein HYH02_008774 [Chlamydomonas schloesseri]
MVETSKAPDGANRRNSLSQRPAAALPGLRNVASVNADKDQEPALVTREGPTKDNAEIDQLYADAEDQRLSKTSLVDDVLNISNVLTDGVSAMVDDSFNKCFTSTRPEPWNWNIYLFPIWVVGVLVRYCILFPVRLTLLMIGFNSLILMFLVVDITLPRSRQKMGIQRKLVQWMCSAWVAAWHGVIRYHGPKPTPGPNRIWVSNHTSMIDYVVLCSYSPFAVIMQLHHGWIAFLQKRILSSLGCLWFNRTEVNDRAVVATRMREHVNNPDGIPLLIFPEGTCVNNEYTVMFKRGAFDIGATVCPVAIKYNKIFVDAFWNSRRESFGKHLFRLLTSWALVCDIYFLEPQTIREGETPQEFAGRVQAMIAKYANLRIVPWDGYLKYYNLGEKNPGLIEKRRRVLADVLRGYLGKGAAQQPAAAAAAGGGGGAEKAAKGEQGGVAEGKKTL